MAHNKIIIVTIHQPSSKLFQMFHKAILLDKGGRLVFFGTPTDMLRYFAEAEHQHQFGAELGACPSCGTTRPEFIFDVLETPLRDLSGDIIYEENNRGQLVPARRYSPEFWRDKYEAFRLIQDVKQVSLRKEARAGVAGGAGAKKEAAAVSLARRVDAIPHAAEARLHQQTAQPRQPGHHARGRAGAGAVDRDAFCAIRTAGHTISRPLITSRRSFSQPDRGDVPRPDQQRRRHHPRPGVLQRERNLNVRLPYYIFAKIAHAGVFALVQCVLFVLIGNYILRNPRDVLDRSRRSCS